MRNFFLSILFIFLVSISSLFASENNNFLDFLNRCETSINGNKPINQNDLEQILIYSNNFDNLLKIYENKDIDRFLLICEKAKDQEIANFDSSISNTLKNRKTYDIIGGSILGSSAVFSSIAIISSIAQEINYQRYNLSSSTAEAIKYKKLSRTSGASLIFFSSLAITSSLTSIYFLVAGPPRDEIREIKYNMENFNKKRILR